MQDNVVIALSEMWSDYDGDEMYGDFVVDEGDAINVRSFELGVGQTEDPQGTPATEYYVADLIGTTRAMTDASGASVDAAVYTAFGERVDGTSHRYGYAGTWGYQSHDAFPFLHVGHRYYDPATGRFLQRDPIGIWGGLNVYEYVGSTPTVLIDQLGMYPADIDFWPLPTDDRETKDATGKGVRRGLEIFVTLGCGSRAAGKLAKLRRYIRFERHPIGGLKGELRKMRFFHVNIGKKHIILDPRYWWRRIRPLF